MRWLFDFLSVTLGGALGWWVGAHVGLFTAVVISAIGSGVGLYYGRRLLELLSS